MNISPLAVVGLALLLIVLFHFWGANSPRLAFRSIKAFQNLQRSIELSVEDGSRLQVTLGSGSLLGMQSAAAFAGLTLLRQVAQIAADSDQPPLATSGDATVLLLAQDSLRTTYRRLGLRDQFHFNLAQIPGVTPFSYAAGVLPFVLDKSVSSNALIGSFANEAGLIVDAAQRSRGFLFGGSDNLSAQSILFAAADEPLIGEELFAVGAYSGAGAAHQASLRTQDVLRWVLILLILVAALAPVFAGQ